MKEWLKTKKKKGNSKEALCNLHYMSVIGVLGILMQSLILPRSLLFPQINIIFIKLIIPFVDVNICSVQ